jgi:LPXTG-site transpeptidase (sortase) family protein
MKLVIGIFLVVVSLLIFGITFFPLVKNELVYKVNQIEGKKIEDPQPLFPDFGIVIPKLAINAKVVKNVNPFDAAIYQKALTQGVAHATGTALPGEKGNIFIFSHSSENFYEPTRYNSIFYLLTKLEKGDIIKLFYEDNEYDYFVQTKQIVGSNAIKYLKNNTPNETLTLMTCWPPGTSLKRLIIEATRH